MRVLFNTYPWAFDCPGGGEMQLLNYARHLPGAGVSVELFDPWAPQFAQADLVHFFSVIGGSSAFCHFVREVKKIPLVITSSLWVNERNLHTYPVEEIRHQMAMAHAVVTNSEMESECLSTAFNLPQSLFRAVHNGVDLSFCQPADPDLFRTQFQIHGDFVLCVGNIEPRKNQLTLVRAMRGLDLPLVLIGQPRDEAYFQAVMAEGGESLRYLGRLDHHSPVLRSAYRACTLFALPSTLETPGLAALEAAAQGAKVAVTGEGSTREYFGYLVTYLDPFDEAQIRQAIATERQRPRGTDLADHVRGHFLWDRIAHDLARVYGEVL
jgi:glycosyltransferase involved in cell wall biosynthesis